MLHLPFLNKNFQKFAKKKLLSKWAILIYVTIIAATIYHPKVLAVFLGLTPLVLLGFISVSLVLGSMIGKLKWSNADFIRILILGVVSLGVNYLCIVLVAEKKVFYLPDSLQVYHVRTYFEAITIILLSFFGYIIFFFGFFADDKMLGQEINSD
jgi:hypothetical protein